MYIFPVKSAMVKIAIKQVIGRAGTGKTTFLRQLKERSPKRMVVVAPTGVAAINAGGVLLLPLPAYFAGCSDFLQNHW